MKRMASLMRVAIVIAILVSGLTLAASPGVALEGIPPCATIHSATFSIYAADATAQTVSVHRITDPWMELSVTWNSFMNAYDSGAVGTFVVNSAGWQSIDVTSLVQAWVDGTLPNHGLFLQQGATYGTKYRSSEYGYLPHRPKLEICYSTPTVALTCSTIQRPGAEQEGVADAWISELNPTWNGGSDVSLYTGLINDKEKQSLIWFDIPAIPCDGCTLTPGYWKTHSEYGPAPYDDTWALLTNGADTPFFLSGRSYYEVLWTEPSSGNAFYILAHAYIAAKLNVLNGASIPGDVLDAWNQAGELLEKYESELSIPKGSTDRALAIELAEMLDAYNNGYIGPGHCME